MKIVRGYTDQGTFGKFYDNAGNFVCHTLERPWVNNEPFVSCIPEGTYFIVPHLSPKYGECYALSGGSISVEQAAGFERYGILIHAANRISELQGCIAPGVALGVLNDQWAVLGSRDGLMRMEDVLRVNPRDNILEITHATALEEE